MSVLLRSLREDRYHVIVFSITTLRFTRIGTSDFALLAALPRLPSVQPERHSVEKYANMRPEALNKEKQQRTIYRVVSLQHIGLQHRNVHQRYTLSALLDVHHLCLIANV